MERPSGRMVSTEKGRSSNFSLELVIALKSHVIAGWFIENDLNKTQELFPHYFPFNNSRLWIIAVFLISKQVQKGGVIFFF